MSTPFLGEVRIFSFNFAPKGWAFCAGQLLPINQNQALFALLGTTYGGNGQTNFALPDLRSRIPVHLGQGAGLQAYVQGETVGVENVALNASNIAGHTHPVNADGTAGGQATPVGNYWGVDSNDKFKGYSTTSSAQMNTNAVGAVGDNAAHSNIQPFLALSTAIALQGIFPSRN